MAKTSERGIALAEFLTGPAILRRIKTTIADDGNAIAAIAYWGPRGVTGTGLLQRRASRTRVLCDLFSGACNPAAIQDLVSAGIKVKTYDGLHSKVWSCGSKTIVGSANASANGLGYEDNELRGNLEAATLIDDAAFAEDTREWFDAIWSSPKAVDVGSSEIESAKPLWEARRRSRHRQRIETFLDLAKQGDGRRILPRVRAIAYTGEDTSPEADSAFEATRETYSSEALAVYPEEYPFYEDETGWDLKPGDIILDYHCARRGSTPQFCAIWQVRRDHPFRPAPTADNPTNRIVLCEPLIDIEGFRITAAQRREIAKLIKVQIAAQNWREDRNDNYFDAPLMSLFG